jgi:transposase
MGANWKRCSLNWDRCSCANTGRSELLHPGGSATSLHRLTYCPECLKKQQEIDRLQEENARLKARLRYQERTAREGFFGSSTPSAKVPVKANTAGRGFDTAPGGARPGHKGHGRKAGAPEQADRVIALPTLDACPGCGGFLQNKGCRQRTVREVQPLQPQRLHYHWEERYCPRCRRTVQPRPPGVLKRNLLGNALLAHAAVQHYVFGVTLGQLQVQLGVGSGTLHGALHQMAELFEPACEQLVQDYRLAPVKHADETGWRTNGCNGYAWLFCSEKISLFRFRQTRSGQIARDVMGDQPLRGVLVVDRYGGYNGAPCALQYCYAHLLRAVQDLEKEFPGEVEVMVFVSFLAPLLAQAMGLRSLELTPQEFRAQASELKARIIDWNDNVASHPGVQQIQNIFREHPDQLYHWADDPAVPADNNRAERELRPLVIARKISFGSQSENGARTREVLMSVLHTLRKGGGNVTTRFQRSLDALASDSTLSPYHTLFTIDSS